MNIGNVVLFLTNSALVFLLQLLNDRTMTLKEQVLEKIRLDVLRLTPNLAAVSRIAPYSSLLLVVLYNE